ncbi:flavodoxin [Anaerocolumna xylanovorans]|uniref:Flavodoxin n=1 Tax=Anaerocolumna xylanovorans DSM 12503 TaxID=1121345 RepID=A0A1M7Y0W2_9FIRM|nr:flavodoxin [Anaerocolumna xylanovorans]SHO45324.1 Flavodoxin [Anaerocolumna xylanovorans DSM 12503]
MRKILLCVVMGLSLVMTACGNQRTNIGSESNTTNSNNTAKAGNQAKINTQEKSEENSGDSNKEAGKNILIAYFAVAENSDVDAVSSASVVTDNGEAKGRVRILADDVQNVTGGDLFSIQTSVKYPGNVGDLIEYANKEKEDKARPELTSHIENLDDYDVIFIGYPTWWYDMPMVMYSFFEENDFSGKTIIPFNSHNGSRFSGTIETIQELEPNATVITDGFTVNERDVSDAAPDIEDWLKGLGY